MEMKAIPIEKRKATIEIAGEYGRSKIFIKYLTEGVAKTSYFK